MKIDSFLKSEYQFINCLAAPSDSIISFLYLSGLFIVVNLGNGDTKILIEMNYLFFEWSYFLIF